MKRAILVLAIVAPACGGKTSPAPAASLPLCVDPAAPGGTPFDLHHDEDRPGLVSDGDDKGVMDAMGAGWISYAAVESEGVTYGVVTRSSCGPADCDAQVVKIEGGKVTAQRPLPGVEGALAADYPFVVTWLIVDDAEVWVGYEVVVQPEGAEQTATHRHLASFAAVSMLPNWFLQHAEWHEDDHEVSCQSEVSRVDADCDGDLDFAEVQTCESVYCAAREASAPDPACEGFPKVTHVIHERLPDVAIRPRKN